MLRDTPIQSFFVEEKFGVWICEASFGQSPTFLFWSVPLGPLLGWLPWNAVYLRVNVIARAICSCGSLGCCYVRTLVRRAK